ncbi:TPA: DUF551 domain-containing protein [Escherichia coli]|nr:DUF551 domain-containing protein [Escherichia coli]ELC8521482.1 DUF551 domain-containing protein [Escherichia coli]ELC8561059.1 DUF551 domain-containing protein [Escherichia coli]ELC8589335.1 DUF551 domain-containing protein [Escherichia coli]MBS9701978.1 DUF551 domain-containing protein [Escherichia coli]MEB7109977.1 DUF551 domain-containing protein [Escherichia coli]
MAELTKEWLKQTIAEYEANRDELPFGLDTNSAIGLQAFKLALASLEAEPIGFRCRRNDNLGDWSYVYHREPDDFERKHLVIEGIYAAPPAPVVPEEATPENVEMLSGYVSTYKLTDSERDIAAEIWNACRAAMLHSAEPASNHEELPLDYLQGQKDGLEWAAQLAEANHPQTGDWLYDDPLDLAKAIRKGPDIPEFAGPHPVTPDGWISCSDLMPEDTKMLLAFSQGEIVAAYWNWVVNPIDYKKYRAFTYLSGNILDDVTHWMPLPEPPQEVK